MQAVFSRNKIDDEPNCITGREISNGKGLLFEDPRSGTVNRSSYPELKLLMDQPAVLSTLARAAIFSRFETTTPPGFSMVIANISTP